MMWWSLAIEREAADMEAAVEWTGYAECFEEGAVVKFLHRLLSVRWSEVVVDNPNAERQGIETSICDDSNGGDLKESGLSKVHSQDVRKDDNGINDWDRHIEEEELEVECSDEEERSLALSAGATYFKNYDHEGVKHLGLPPPLRSDLLALFSHIGSNIYVSSGNWSMR
ncbi:hypothetical protein LguiA_026154 [Lonicera macranthoides]